MEKTVAKDSDHQLAEFNIALGRLVITSKVTNDERGAWLHVYTMTDAPIWCVQQEFAVK